ncbi:MAG: helicase-related protein [Pseudomonadota bacterium]
MSQPARRSVTAILGPTNTGKTHEAIERMLRRPSGIIGLPLRLLAREVYDKVVGKAGRGAVALITGEEKIQPPRASYFVCTVEAMPLERDADIVVIDEIQMCADPERGHIFTDRLLHARGREETLFLGAETIRSRIADLVPETRFERRERFSTLSYAGSKKISRLKPRSAVVAFSVDQVYAIAELIRRQRGGAAVVMGALSPRTRNAQVELYQTGDVDYLVATDAIGMGLNMDVDHIAFAGRSKFDGRRMRMLMPNELAQIAGRAGRYTKDGTFGVTGEVEALEPEVVQAIEAHRFSPIKALQWRNSQLSFGSVAHLIRSLEEPANENGLSRAREADDLAALKLMAEDRAILETARHPDRVRLLWEVCQVPDFRKTAPAEHVALLSRIYRFLLSDAGVIPSSWIADQLRRIDRVEGEIDTLSKRLAFIRTWTYVANRGQWLEDAAEWREETRAIEDRLGDALHARLTQRFVDRRSSVLMRRLKQKERLVADVNDKGEVTAEGHFLGRLDGFRFTLDESATSEEIKTLRSASMSALAAEFTRRADKLYLSPDSEIDVTDQGGLMWGTDAIGKLERGESPLQPAVRVFVDDFAGPEVAEKVQRRLTHWISRKIAALFEPLFQMRDDEAVTGLAKGVAFQLVEAMGIIPRPRIADDIKQLAQEDRALLRKHGVRFGQHNIFLPALLKPAPARMRLVLWSLWKDLPEFPEAPPPGHVTFPAIQDAPEGYYETVGYRLSGQRAVRIDMLERLADLLRPMDVRGGFEATPDMLSITGCTLDQLADILGSLGFKGERGERPKAPRPVTESSTAKGAQPTTPPPTESSAPQDDAASDASATAAEAGTDAQLPEAASTEAPEGAPDAVSAAAEDAASATPDPMTPAERLETEPPAPMPDDTNQAGEEGESAAAEVAEIAPDPAPEAETPATEPQPAAAPNDAADTPDGTAGAAPSQTAEPETEVFYTFTLARRPRPQDNRGRGPRRGQDQGRGQEQGRGEGRGQGRGQERGQERGQAAPDGGKPDNAGGPGKRRRGKGAKPDSAAEGRPPRQNKPKPKPEKREVKVDPDSPFAILQQLKNK